MKTVVPFGKQDLLLFDGQGSGLGLGGSRDGCGEGWSVGYRNGDGQGMGYGCSSGYGYQAIDETSDYITDNKGNIIPMWGAGGL